MANVFGENEVSDWVLATLLVYAGYPIVKCVSDGRNTHTTWTFRGVPSEDFTIYQDEVTRSDTSVILPAFIAALKTVQDAQAQARRNCGVYVGTCYARRS